MIPDKCEVVIIGSGAVGACTAYYLAKKGITDVVVLEKSGSLGGATTSICAGGMRSQFTTEINIELSKLSFRLLEQLDSYNLVQDEMDQCGYMFIFTAQDNLSEFYDAMLLQQRLGVQTEWMEPKQIQKKLPMLVLEDVAGATYNKQDGLIDPNKITNAYIRLSRELGVKYYPGVAVTDFITDGSAIQQVVTSEGAITSRVVVNATGPWSKFVAAKAGIELPVIPCHQQLLVTDVLPWLPADFPVIVFPGEGLGLHKETGGLLTGLNKPFVAGVCEDPDYNYSDPEWEYKHLEAALRRLPRLQEATIKSCWGGYYDDTLDSHPVLGADNKIQGFYHASGFSGHGFMHSPAAGLLISEEIAGNSAQTLDISSLRSNRWLTAAGRKINEYYKI
ncbi:FAD-binding oxidoreductase [Paenibacillus sp. FSL R7-0048]|uniref:NAD(P)/FAD-dependent oxidoreductase n=1 Tax=Paenibacillus TaxID=44249 RepID=UPI00096DF490|nr:FAD-binding oxidoreductase [Paenibacillus odorifer]OMD64410.1 hypothetical protein BSK48_24975 [Paenibacillus odorifer]OMD72281.1 hypothetical protein BSK50_24490 [Paenibacillus odorifer]OMD87426.1 hypothetical protein BSK67_27610 [Paenibacillus odorifer]OMD87473.1 hypothetical protein BSK53_00215 [Paenibacillus odorifer]